MKARHYAAGVAGYAGLLGLLSIFYVMAGTGTSASGGPYEITNECPGGTWLLPSILLGSLFLIIVGGVAFVIGNDVDPQWSPLAAMVPGTRQCAGFGVLVLIVSVAGAYGPNGGSEDRLAAWLLGGFFAAFGIGMMLFVRWLRAS